MEFKNIYFLGIGGIGMSAIARYFLHAGRRVAGYDLTRTPLTERLEREGAHVVYRDGEESIPSGFRDPADTLVVYTPAVPSDHPQAQWFRAHGFRIEKRSEMLGHIAEGKYVMAVAGTHGKTTTTTLTAWLNHIAADDCGEGAGDGKMTAECGDDKRTCGGGSAFLGGISKNFDSNLVLGKGRRLAVEADEFDRSFLRLHPDVAVITSVDPDHLDVYGDHEAMKEAFRQFAAQIEPGGALILKDDIELNVANAGGLKIYRYSLDRPCDFHASGIRLREGGYYDFDLHFPDRVVGGCTLGVPGLVNVENAVAAAAMMWVAGFDEERLKEALAAFKGVKRRFEFWINTPQIVYIDDYAHHPRELTAAIGSIRAMFPGRRMTAVFQPHLYTRTRDFYREFGEALSMADDVVLVPIYPAREAPIEGITSEIIGRYVTVPWMVSSKEDIADTLAARDDLDVVVTFGAGDIENYCARIAEKFNPDNV